MSGSMGAGDSVLLGVVRKQRSRLIATVMGAIEKEAPDLSGEAMGELRREVTQGVNRFSDFVIDSLRSSREQADLVNDEVLRTLGKVRRG